MKKSLLILFILASASIWGQEPFFDYKKHLEKKQREWFSPDKKIDGTNAIHDLFKNFQKKFSAKNTEPTLLKTLPNGTRIFALPQDNMTCIVPDLKHFNMPNPAKGMKISGMPPGSSEGEKLIPDFEK